MARKTPPRLHKVEEKKPLLSEIGKIRLGIILGLILLALLFIIICFVAIPQTYGFFWY